MCSKEFVSSMSAGGGGYCHLLCIRKVQSHVLGTGWRWRRARRAVLLSGVCAAGGRARVRVVRVRHRPPVMATWDVRVALRDCNRQSVANFCIYETTVIYVKTGVCLYGGWGQGGERSGLPLEQRLETMDN